ncbi:MAG: bifunctional enoyl-CoA hydratase/phosphate acetyltransferase [Pseudomonadota bacterium]|nr:bifunctional enoyl-CoA hydratase/phosphate acetyltransferase [Pseudomonadota bacterium]
MAVCPPYLLDLVNGAAPLRTGVVNAGSAVVMESVRDAVRARLIEPVLYGNPAAIKREAEALRLDTTAFDIVAASDEEDAANKAAAGAGRGETGALLKGQVHTDVFMRAVLARDAGLRSGKPLTHVFHMTAPGRDQPLLITDGALNPAPDIELKKSIIANAVLLAHALGNKRPQVALLSATEEPSPRIPSSTEAVELTVWAKKAVQGADVYGPLAFDLAVSSEAARIKGVSLPVAGKADILVVPEIVCGNALFKMMVQFMDACAAGIVLGAKVPVLLTSRSDPPPARLASMALAVAMQAAGKAN